MMQNINQNNGSAPFWSARILLISPDLLCLMSYLKTSIGGIVKNCQLSSTRIERTDACTEVSAVAPDLAFGIGNGVAHHTEERCNR